MMLFTENLGDILNRNTGHLIDWNRVGGLIGKHRYSTKELLERGFIITSMAVGGFLAENQREQGGFGYFAGGATLGFLISHTITVSPLIYKRLKSQWVCNEIKARLEEQLKTEPEISSPVLKIIDQILNW